MAAKLLIQLCADGLGKDVEDNSSVWAHAKSCEETRWRSWFLASVQELEQLEFEPAQHCSFDSVYHLLYFKIKLF